jgi:hypothetical protein
MTNPYMKRTISVAWMCVPVAVGIATQPTSAAGWLALSLAALIPPAVVMYLWREPVLSTSEAIQEALR